MFYYYSDLIYESSLLGIANKEGLDAYLKKMLRTVIENFAITYYKSKGEL